MSETTDHPLPSVAGRMEMTHEDFQWACQMELGRLQEDPNCDNHIVHLLCEAYRCSRECCELAVTHRVSAEQVAPLVEALREACAAAFGFERNVCMKALEHALVLGLVKEGE